MRPCLIAVLACALVLPASALAAPFDDVFADYQDNGRIEPCKHSAEELQQAKDDIPNDIDQYAPEFPAALDAAMEERARGCDGESPADTGAAAPGATTTTPSGGTPAPVVPGTTTPTTTPGQTPAPPGTAQPAPAAGDGAIENAASRGDDSGGDFPPAILALAILLGLLALASLVWGLFRFFAWEPRWLLGARHSVAEAGWRTSGAWADFTDWLRSRRSAA